MDVVEVEAVVGEASLLGVVAGVVPGVGVVGAHPEAGVVEVEEEGGAGAWVCLGTGSCLGVWFVLCFMMMMKVH